jgi:hypothetical protein
MDAYPGGMTRTMRNRLFAAATGADDEEANDFIHWVGYNRPVKESGWRESMDANALWQQFVQFNR